MLGESFAFRPYKKMTDEEGFKQACYLDMGLDENLESRNDATTGGPTVRPTRVTPQSSEGWEYLVEMSDLRKAFAQGVMRILVPRGLVLPHSMTLLSFIFTQLGQDLSATEIFDEGVEMATELRSGRSLAEAVIMKAVRAILKQKKEKAILLLSKKTFHSVYTQACAYILLCLLGKLGEDALDEYMKSIRENTQAILMVCEFRAVMEMWKEQWENALTYLREMMMYRVPPQCELIVRLLSACCCNNLLGPNEDPEEHMKTNLVIAGLKEEMMRHLSEANKARLHCEEVREDWDTVLNDAILASIANYR